ncbi:hypothetical protein Tco_1355928, partial [Tanacetum coccineum]
EAVHKELGDRMERAATTASSLEAEQDSDAQTWFETTSKQFNDPPLSKVNTFRSGEDKRENVRIYIGDGNVCWIKIGVNTAWHQLNTASINTTEDGILATIDGRDKIVTAASIRRHLKLQDSKGLSSLPNA